MMSAYVMPGVKKIRRPVVTVSDNTKIIVITSAVKKYRPVTDAELFSKKRNRRIVEARQLIMYFISSNTRLGVVRIGRIFNRDHTTVLHSNKAVRNLTETDDSYRKEFQMIEEQIRKELMTISQRS